MSHDMSRFSQGFASGLEHGRALLLGRIRRRLRELHANALRFTAEGDLASTPSAYWEARADLLQALINEFEEL